jgi:putative endonuclease
MEKGGAVYIMTNIYNSVLYIGATSDLVSRVIQHKQKLFPNSFTAKYNCSKLVYFKSFHSIEEALAEEKRLKGGNRARKIALVNSINEPWYDLWEIIKEW